MEVTYIFLGLLIIGLLVYCGIKLNNYSIKRYDYKPVDFLNMLLMAIPFVLLFFGFLIFKNDINQLFSIIFSLIIILGVFINIESKTDFYVALGSIIILLFGGLLLFIFILGSSRNNNDDYYYR